MHPPEGPPVCTALNFFSGLERPPPMSNTISPIVVPMGTSAKPLLLIFPAKANTLVPLDFSVPMDANQSAPFLNIVGMFEKLSTLLMTVGLFHRPELAGNGGLGRGSPRIPITELRRAVSSPHTNAPAPSLTSMLKSKPEFRISLPKSPSSLPLQWLCAAFRLPTGTRPGCKHTHAMLRLHNLLWSCLPGACEDLPQWWSGP